MEKFFELYRRLLRIDYFGTAGPPLPNEKDISSAISKGKQHLPNFYIENYAFALESNIDRLLELVSQEELPKVVLETLSAAVYQHQHDYELREALRRFLAVVSNAYRSFLPEPELNETGAPLNEIPPLCLFQHSGEFGPFTVVKYEIQKLIGSTVPLVSLPATYSNDPLIWGIVAHEVGGHNVTHSTQNLITELQNGISDAISELTSVQGISHEQMVILWSYWIDEAASDVYGIMNLGPSFCPNMSALFSASSAQGVSIPPKLRSTSRFSSADPNRVLDPHPTDILRLSIQSGAVDQLNNLSEDSRDKYQDIISNLTDILTNDSTISIQGNIPVSRDHLLELDISIPLAILQPIARRIGQYISTTKLESFAGQTIQEIETWDDYDEERSQEIMYAVLSNQPIFALGDDAHFIAGSTMAMLENPSMYDSMTVLLNEALDHSFIKDPIWGKPTSHNMFWTTARNFV